MEPERPLVPPEREPERPLVPRVFEVTNEGERSSDIFSRLLKERIVLVGTPIDDTMANLVIAQMLFCESEDEDADMWLYINSPGGSITASLAIYDTIQFVKPDVATLVIGQAASEASLLLAGGAKGKRYALPNARILLHQPRGEVEGQAVQVDIQAQEVLRSRTILDRILSERTGQPLEKVSRDTDRDFIMDVEEAIAYGVIDQALTTRETTSSEAVAAG